MAQTMVNLHLDTDLINGMEQACKDMGLSVTTAFTMFATKVSKEQRIPFEVAVDPVYSKANVDYLLNAIADVRLGRATLTEHELVEVDDD